MVVHGNKFYCPEKTTDKCGTGQIYLFFYLFLLLTARTWCYLHTFYWRPYPEDSPASRFSKEVNTYQSIECVWYFNATGKCVDPTLKREKSKKFTVDFTPFTRGFREINFVEHDSQCKKSLRWKVFIGKVKQEGMWHPGTFHFKSTTIAA